MNYQKRFEEISLFLKQYEEIINNEVIYDYLKYRNYYPANWIQEIAKLNEEHESAVFVLNFKTVKEMAIQCSNLCLSKMKEIVPKIL